MNATMSVLFFARKSKSNRRGDTPIYMRITINGERYDLGTKRFVEIENWLPEAGRVKGSSEAAKSINSFLDLLRAKAFEHQKQILLVGKQLTQDSETCRQSNFNSQWKALVDMQDIPQTRGLQFFSHRNTYLSQNIRPYKQSYF